MTYLINEIFYSIQGEGAWAGTACSFVRFQTCNRECEFCDTQRGQGEPLDEEGFLSAVQELSTTNRVVLTGGEPFYQPKLEDLVKHLIVEGRRSVHIETNGDLLPSINPFPPLVWISVSPKEWLIIPSYVNEVKYLVGDGQELWERALRQPPRFREFVQPVWGEHYQINLAQCVHLVKKYPYRFQLSTQQHKNWGIR
jgi:organic radical activating enzyme